MKMVAIPILLLVLSAAAFADAETGRISLRIAESSNTCLISCASQNDACKRMCPTAYNGPCTGACDNQAQFCRQACQQK